VRRASEHFGAEKLGRTAFGFGPPGESR
jgi:hypothetical protein